MKHADVRTKNTMRIIGVVVALAVAAAIFNIPTPTPQYAIEKASTSAERDAVYAQFAREIAEFGSEQAYQRLSVALMPLADDWQHQYAHDFGHVLYGLEGESGIASCDFKFGYGCIHQIMSETIIEHGPSSVARLFESCRAATGGYDLCMHGLGHGLLSSVGYEESDLVTATQMCEGIEEETTSSGCKGGVFMEYNLRNIAAAEGILRNRVADESRMHEPCDRVTANNKKPCIFWLPQWWFFVVLRGDRSAGAENAAYRTIGELCEASDLPQTCYEGLGYITPTAFRHDPLQARLACDSLVARSEARVFCRGMSGLVFRLDTGSALDSFAMCVDLPDKERAVCQQYAVRTDITFSAEAVF